MLANAQVLRLIRLFSVERLFRTGWELSAASIVTVFRIEMPADEMSLYQSYMCVIVNSTSQQSHALGRNNLWYDNEELLHFHGTRRSCSIGDSRDLVRFCYDDKCNLCSIIKGSFSITRAGSRNPKAWSKYGRGIYVASSASKCVRARVQHNQTR